MAKAESIRLRLTQEEKQKFKEFAAREHLTLSAWIIRALHLTAHDIQMSPAPVSWSDINPIAPEKSSSGIPDKPTIKKSRSRKVSSVDVQKEEPKSNKQASKVKYEWPAGM